MLCVCVCCCQSLEECESHGLPPTEQGRLDLEMKIEDTKENMRKAEVCDSDRQRLLLSQGLCLNITLCVWCLHFVPIFM